MKIMTQIMKKKEKTCLKSIVLKLFDVIPMIFLNCRQNKFVHIKFTQKKAENEVINKITDDFKK